mgnify:CR=1 FL=1
MSITAAVFAALWLGLLTSVSPCPLASNIAAISFIGRKAGRPTYVFGSGVSYTLGRAMAYVVIGALVLAGMLAGGELSRFLQLYMNQILGPVLILIFAVGFGWLPVSGYGTLAHLILPAVTLGGALADGNGFFLGQVTGLL